MALSKTISALPGVNATYHRLSFLNVNYRAMTTAIVLDSYVSKETRDGFIDNPIATRNFTIPAIPPEDGSAKNDRAWAYGWLTGSTDMQQDDVVVSQPNSVDFVDATEV